MSLLLRLLLLLLTYRFRPRCPPLGPARRSFVVGPADLDVLGHVNNGVYLTLLDVARVDLLLRSGSAGPLRARRLYPVVAAETIRFRRSLRLFQGFETETQIIGWDEKALVLRHRFVRGEDTMAEAFVRWRFLQRGGGAVSSEQVLEALGHAGPSPQLPAWVDAWNRENAAR
jgi:acyl-CoA thioesterase FadM